MTHVSNEDSETQRTVFEWYTQLLDESPGVDLLPAIRERQARSPTALESKALLTTKSWEEQRQGLLAESARTLLQQWELDKDDPMPLISLASQQLNLEGDSKRAHATIRNAIAVAERVGNFRRYALGVGARIALAMGDFQSLSECLLRIAETQVQSGERDIGKERDFFDRIPPGSVASDVLERYSAYLKR
jgi:hypothetical protein